jgi:hypothetical protein
MTNSTTRDGDKLLADRELDLGTMKSSQWTLISQNLEKED